MAQLTSYCIKELAPFFSMSYFHTSALFEFDIGEHILSNQLVLCFFKRETNSNPRHLSQIRHTRCYSTSAENAKSMLDVAQYRQQELQMDHGGRSQGTDQHG